MQRLYDRREKERKAMTEDEREKREAVIARQNRKDEIIRYIFKRYKKQLDDWLGFTVKSTDWYYMQHALSDVEDLRAILDMLEQRFDIEHGINRNEDGRLQHKRTV